MEQRQPREAAARDAQHPLPRELTPVGLTHMLYQMYLSLVSMAKAGQSNISLDLKHLW